MDGYRHRIMDSLLEKKLQAKGAVLIEGPKWCGKTTTAEEIAASKIMLARTDVKNNLTYIPLEDRKRSLEDINLHLESICEESQETFRRG